MLNVLLAFIFTVIVTLVVRKFIEMSEETFDDYRQIAFETPLEQRPFWVERWNRWVTVRELTGSQRSKLLQQCTEIDGKKATVNLEKLYPMLVVLSVRYPDPSNLPELDHPHFHEFPGANGKPAHPKAGKPIFNNIADMGPLNAGPGNILELLNKPAAELSGLRPEDVEEKKLSLEVQTVESDAFIIE